MTAGESSAIEIIDIDDERSALASEAVALIEQTFDPRDRQTGDGLPARETVGVCF